MGLGVAYSGSLRFVAQHPGPVMITATATATAILGWWGVLVI